MQAVIARWGQLPTTETLEPGEPPLLLVHGAQDRVIPVERTRALERRSQTVGTPVQSIILEEAGHGFGEPDNHRWRKTEGGRTPLDQIHDFLFNQVQNPGGEENHAHH